jgi:hypothetical protein
MSHHARLGDRLPSRETLFGLAALAAIGAGGVIGMYIFARHPGAVSEPAAECQVAYRRAHTANDTAIVDAQTVTEGRGRIPGALNCGALRTSGELH